MLSGQSTFGTAINDRAEIIGSSPSGFLFRDGAFHVLPVLKGGTYDSPKSINNQGDVVGMCDVGGPGPSRACLYTGGKLKDLNKFVDPSLTLLTGAAGINDKGQIVATGLNGQMYVLTLKH